VDLHRSWAVAWQGLGVLPDEALYEALVASYSEPQRRYHTLQHLEECFHQLEKITLLALRPAEIQLALWFHDAIYDTHRQDNEERSAHWARQAISPVSVEAADRVHGLVMATRHEAVAEGIDAGILIDVDLSILGADSQRFDEYEAQIRAEYDWVAQAVYRRERRKVLASFASRSRIFSTKPFFELHEAQARANIARSLARL
jgi:predicted metal-dependent HD superfamily phosphohydrolase